MKLFKPRKYYMSLQRLFEQQRNPLNLSSWFHGDAWSIPVGYGGGAKKGARHNLTH